MIKNLFSETRINDFHLRERFYKLTAILLFLFVSIQLKSQVLINPTGDGGFENGTTFATNGWITAQTGNGREWQVGTAAGAQSPTRAAFIGNAANNNGIGSAKTVHFYKDVVIPVGATNVILSFYLKQTVVDNTYDYFRVFTTTTATTPVNGAMPGAGYTQVYQNTATQYNNFTVIPGINLTALAGTTVRLVFTFKSDGINPNANPAVDNISLTYTLPTTCPTPTAPTNLQLVAATTTSVNGTFTAPATLPSGFMVVRSTSATAPTIANGTIYNTGTTFGTTPSYYVVRGSNTNDVSTSFSDTGLAASTVYNYYVYSFNNGCSGTKPIYSTALAKSITTTIATYCTSTILAPNSSAQVVYIDKVSFIGTLNDYINTSTYSTSPRGYQNFTVTGPAQQIQGESINIFVSNTGTATDDTCIYKAWIDLNNDGDFNDTVNGISEKIYDSGSIFQTSTTFGFLVPENLPPGNYRLRIKINWIDNVFDACSIEDYAETEDYTIRVVEKCVAKVTSIINGSRCGSGEVTMSVATENADFVRWYTTPTGGSPVATTAVNSNTSIYSPNLTADAVYYVTAYNTVKNCEYQIRKEIKATVKILPNISFSVAAPEICGDSDPLEVTAVGGNQIEYLVDENFETANLGVFTSVKLTGDTSTNINANWTAYTSPYQPLFGSWNPVISSGFKGNHFVMTTSDLATGTYKRALELTNFLTTNNFTNLTLKFRVYFSKYYDPGTTEFVAVQGLYNGTWEDLSLLTTDTGQGNNFATATVILPNKYLNRTDVKFRIVYNANWNDGVAVDDVQLYGEKTMLNASFAFYGGNMGIFTNATGTTPYTAGDFITKVYIKPNVSELESTTTWNISAIATLLNGCSAEGEITIQNNSKIWNPSTAVNDWATTNWKPTTAAPTADKCVIIKKPVVLGASTNGFAKNIKIETASGSTGNLNIAGSLTVTDNIITTAATDLLVESDGNLNQLNESLVNTTPISVRRLHTLTGLRKEYNYLSSPVADQNMKLIFGNNAAYVPFVTKLNEATNYFVNATAADYLIKAKGFGVKEPTTAYTGVPAASLASDEAEYKGIPNNGNGISLPLAWTSGRGYNLAGNPYPSNIDIIDLYNNSTTSVIDPTFRFWDNVVNEIYVQMGGAYQGYSYALFNALTGPDGFGIKAPGDGSSTASSKIPTRIIKVSQAFMIRATGAGAQLNFNNAMRKTTNAGTVFYGKTSTQNCYRLQLVKSDGFTVQNGVAYFNAGSQDFGREDTRIPNSQASDALFSYAGDAKVVINGRSTFTTEDVVSLGLRHFAAGTYTIQAVDEEGVFANGQTIYLKDKQLGILTDLTAGDYIFTSESGEFTNRFEIVYKEGLVLAADNTNKGKIEVFRDASDFVVRSSDKSIERVELYDASGRMVFTMEGNAKEMRFNSSKLVDGMYILKAELKGGEQLTKKIRK